MTPHRTGPWPEVGFVETNVRSRDYLSRVWASSKPTREKVDDSLSTMR